MCKSYIAAGLDPARFWEITPRLFALEMSGAQAKWQAERALVWWGAMLPHIKDPPDLEKFAGYEPDKRAALARCVAAWDKIDAALRRKRRGQ